ncbi:trichohyalin-like [Saccostrea echinata]|uniref:trichohyalin-like n=1 Tax=Saccostrea echinata TaxID=191078 RepID=UPI002A7EA9CB|nr:trichohyalin-like [Saccostrea echinata]
MSTLEERREARRRRRQQEEAGLQLTSEEDFHLQERLERRRKEREERLKLIAAGVNAINGEDELERRRRERREMRLRSSETTEETTTSRRSRRRGTEDETDATEESSYTSTRSRRRRGYDEEDTPAAPEEPQVDPEEEARKRRAAQAEQDRLEEEERARKEEEAEERARQEEIRRQQEEERRRQEEERRRQEEAERAKREEIDNILERQRKEREEQELKINERIRNLQSAKDTVNEDLFIDEDSWNNHSNRGNNLLEMDRRKSESNKTSQLKTFFEDRMEEQKSNGLHVEVLRKDGSNRRHHPGNLSLDESSQSHVQERLIKFQSSLQNSPKDTAKDIHLYHAKVISPGTDRLKDIQKRFEGEKNGDLSNNRLGRLSASETHLNITEKSDSPRFGSKKVLDRWHPPTDSQKSPLATSFKATSTSNMDNGASRKSGTVTLLASKFITSKESLNENHVATPTDLERSESFKDVSSIRRQWSQVHSAEKPEPASTSLRRQKSVGSKVTERWQFDRQGSLSSQNDKEQLSPSTIHREPLSPSRTHLFSASSQDNQVISPSRSRPLSTSSIDSQKDVVVVATPVTITTNGWHRTNGSHKEEEERLERERLEREEAEREEAARRMEEEQKKRSRKRKGLGGLDKEKKNKLKDLHDESESADDEDDGSMSSDSSFQSLHLKSGSLHRVTPLPSDLESMSKAALVKLCKDLHTLVATLEEELYDWNMKVRKQEAEINSLTLKVNDSKGKFIKPVLRKVNKESKFDKLKKDKSDFRGNLKSTGQSKYALDEEGEEKAE